MKLSKKAKEKNANESEESKLKRKNTINEKVRKGEWHTSLAKNMHINYKGVDLHGSWELKYAQYLDANGIRWIRNKESFHYFFEGTDRRYTPDFYLPDFDQYVEIKGHKTNKDDAKWSQFPSYRKLVILTKVELKKLAIL